MKIVLSFLFALVAVKAQDTATDTLLRQQEDLTLGHRFFEEQIMLSRNTLSTYMYGDSRALIKSHIDAIASIRDIEDLTNQLLDAITVTQDNEECLEVVRNRWLLQLSRFGHRLAMCMDVSRRRN